MGEFNLSDTDMMGYQIDNKSASFHHLIIPHRNSGVKSVINGAVLNRNTAHPYLHVIESKEYDIFFKITKLMMKENYLGRLDQECLRQIDDLLKCFEREFSGSNNILGEPLIREEYVKRLKL